jgi:hypothetical protein
MVIATGSAEPGEQHCQQRNLDLAGLPLPRAAQIGLKS